MTREGEMNEMINPACVRQAGFLFVMIGRRFPGTAKINKYRRE